MQFFKPNIEKMKAKRDIDGLIKALGYEKDSQVRSEAALALGEIRDRAAVEPLIAALKVNGTKLAAKALGELKDARAVEPLIVALQEWDSFSSWWAAEALGKIGDARAVEPLIAALKDSNEYNRTQIAAALDNIGAPAVQPLIAKLKHGDENERKVAAKALVKIGAASMEIGAPNVQLLIVTLKHGDMNERKAAAKALVKIGAAAVEPLITNLKDEDTSMRRQVVEALAQIGDLRAVEPLIGALKDSDEGERYRVASALDKIGWQPGKNEAGIAYWIAKNNWEECVRVGTPAVEPLIAVLKNGTRSLEAADALGKIGDARAVEPLIAALKYEKNNSYDRRAVVEALGKIGAPAVEALIAVIKDKEIKDKESIHKYAAEALESDGWKPGNDETGAAFWVAKQNWEECVRIGIPAIEPLINALRSYQGVGIELYEKVVEALVKIGTPAVGPLVAGMGIGHISDTLLEQALKKIGPAAVEPLFDALKDPNQSKCSMAAETLGRIGDLRAVMPLILLLKEGGGAGCSAAEALGKIGDLRAVEPLLSALKTDVQYSATEALAHMYRGGKLDERSKSLILSHQRELRRPHQDYIFTGGHCPDHTDIAPSELIL